MVREVISVCHGAHVDVWKHTSRLLQQFIEADEYTVFVPSKEVDFFKSVSPGGYRVEPQESLDSGFHQALSAALANSPNVNRLGWYLQQFYKIEALRRSTAEEAIIWDADCVPVRELSFFTPDGNPIFMTQREYHSPYFKVIRKTLRLRRKHKKSFVTPGFPIPTLWVTQFIEALQEGPFTQTWWQKLVDNIDFRQSSGFSETETLGTWITYAHPRNWIRGRLRWERLGQSLFGHPAELSTEQVIDAGAKENLDVISFELWDLPAGPRVKPNFFHRTRRNLKLKLG